MHTHEQPDDNGPPIIDRRRALRVSGGAGLGLGVVGLAARGASSAALAAAATGSDSTIPTASEEIPDETGGPFPGDGTNGANVLAEEGVVRSDITASFGTATGVATGIPLTVVLNVQNVANGGNPLTGAAVYLWHCDAEGNYSLYSEGVTEENYLRGVQEVDADGNATFTTIYPGCYSGRWPHIHFEVYESLAAATNGRNAIKTSQLAFPQGVSETAYADDRYPTSTDNLEQLSLESDNVFGEDSAALQLAIMSGDNDSGYTATLAVGV
jgi:protocatechuate 3,4-dioxygenase beta subunit